MIPARFITPVLNVELRKKMAKKKKPEKQNLPELPENLLRKQFIAKVEADDDERTVTAVISTNEIDRDGEIILPSGAELENYLKNPVVLWAHSYGTPPIARTLWMKQGRKAITAKIKFADTDRAEEVYQLFKGGFMKAFSIGFIPKDSHTPTPEEIKKKPELADARRIFDKWELLEFSAVPVPANPSALATAVKTKGIAVSDELLDELGYKDIEDDSFTWSLPEVTSDYVGLTEVVDLTGGIKTFYVAQEDGSWKEAEKPPVEIQEEIKVTKPEPVVVKKPIPVTVKQVIKVARPIVMKRVIVIDKKKIKDEAVKMLQGIVYD